MIGGILVVEIFSRFNPPPSVDTTFEGESLTQQHFADECDINNIISNFDRTGFLVDPTLPVGRSPQFGDFTQVMSRLSLRLMLLVISLKR